ncbi:MAG: hypothetical protein ACP5KJ_01665 [Candidatus Micrarchaeia archaeon]
MSSKTLLAFVLLATTVFATYCDSGKFPDWVPFSLLAIVMGMVLYSLIYMLGSLLSRPELKGIAREGIGDVAGVVIFIIFTLMLAEFLCGVTPSALGIDFGDLKNREYIKFVGGDPKDISVLKLGEVYLQLLYYEGEKFYKTLLFQLMYAGAITSVKIGAGSVMGSIQPFGGIEPLLNFAPYMLSSITILLITISTQYHMLKFFEFTGLSFFFPLGILMRVIPATRSLGASLIAFSIGMYFIYPLILSYNFYILVNSVKIDDALLNSYLYNTPVCEFDDDCNSGVCQQIGARKYCAPCILTGDLPKDGDPSMCCNKTSIYNDGKCELKSDIENDPDSLKAGGIISRGVTPSSYGLLTSVGVLAILGVASKTLSLLPGVDRVVSAVTGLAVLIFQLGAALITISPFSFIMHPLFTLVILLAMNTDFFFIGFVLPVIEFIILIELIRTLTASIGEPIDIIQVFRVI